MDKSQFVYVTYISTSPEKLWNALIDPKLTAKYWQHENLSDWKPGSKWEHRGSDKERILNLIGRRFSQMNTDNHFLSPTLIIRIHPCPKSNFLYNQVSRKGD